MKPRTAGPQRRSQMDTRTQILARVLPVASHRGGLPAGSSLCAGCVRGEELAGEGAERGRAALKVVEVDRGEGQPPGRPPSFVG